GATAGEVGPPAWPEPMPLDGTPLGPPFPVECLPLWLALWVEEEARATQTPPDLAAMLALGNCGAALAKKFRVRVRQGWSEPTNLFIVVSLPPGERKSAVFSDAFAPVEELERDLRDRAAPEIAEAQSERRVLEAMQKAAEQQLDKADHNNAEELRKHRDRTQELARQLARQVIPKPPQLFCDDVTPEKLSVLLAEQCGRMLQASPEGTAFEIAKGRYSETANFDVYLKGHAGDSLRVARITREGEMVEQPALSLVLAVQPDVLQGLAGQATMRGRGFLARHLYSLPRSLVGRRKIAARPVAKAVVDVYARIVRALWELPGAAGERGPEPHWLEFSAAADEALQRLERWLEPQLAEGQDLY